MAEFTHLHLHTQYSLLDGAIRLDDLFPKVLERGMKQVAITDHGNLFGALDFYEKAKKHGVKPIFGCETYIAPDRHDKTERRSNHLILLAKDNVGWKNLSYLNSMGYLEGFYYNPRIDKKLLREHSEGLIGLSACLGGEVAQLMMRRGPEAAETAAREFDDIFGRGNFFLEMQPNGLEEQEQVNGHLVELSKKTGIPVIATNDCHYLNKTDAHAHEILMCVQQKKTIQDEKRMHHRNEAFFVKTPAEMDAYFKHIPEAMENAARVGELCSHVEFDLGKSFLPRFTVPEGYDADTYVTEVAREGLKKRIEEAHRRGAKVDGDLYAARLELELGVIKRMQFPGYFLIVWDFIRHAKEQRIPVGPGRGSGAGSLVAYCMRITDIDPIEHKLLFERFLNPERVSMPDFDIDFCMNRRDEVINYVTQKYGKDNVGQIVTMHQIKARSGIRDIARAMAIPFAEADKVAKFVPEPIQGKSPPIAEAIEKEPRLKALYDENPIYRELLDIAKRLEGLNRHAGTHAAGVVIGDRPLWEYVPCFRPAGEEGIVTQYDKDMVEKAGLVKFDFLGLKTLTVIQTCIDLVNREKEAAGALPLDLSVIALDDASGLQDDLQGRRHRRLPAGVERLPRAAEEAQARLLRGHRRRGRALSPGPARGRHGRRLHRPQARAQEGRVRPPAARADPARHLRRHRLPGAGHADLVGARRLLAGQGRSSSPRDGQEEGGGHGQGEGRLPRRRAGQEDRLAHRREGVRPDGEVRGLRLQPKPQRRVRPADLPDRVLEVLLAGRVLRRPAHLRQGQDRERGQVHRRGARAGYRGAAPRHQRVGHRLHRRPARPMTVDDGKNKKAIRFGLGAVKGVGEGAVEVIKAARDEGGPFLSLFDFCKRVDGRKVNRKVLEALVKSGAFDGVAASNAVSRAKLFAAIGLASDRAAAHQREKESGQTSLLALFGGGGGNGKSGGKSNAAFEEVDRYPDADEWFPKETLAFEKESLGFYISGHPMDRYLGEIKKYTNATTANCIEKGVRAEVTLAGIVSNYQERPMKSGAGKYAFFTLEDHFGQIEFIVNSKKVEEYRDSWARTTRCWSSAPSTRRSATARPRASACASTTPSCCPRCAARRARCWRCASTPT